MKKIGIITLNGYFNFGNRLQNFALQEVLKNLDFEVETLWVENVSTKNSKVKKRVGILKVPRLILRKFYRTIYVDPLNSKREIKFRKFTKDYIKVNDTKISENYLPADLLDKYDYFVTGSDQVWNPYFTKGSPLYHLTFAPKEKRIAYAPSFGIDEIPKNFETDFQQWLSEMNSLSVREDAGAKIIRKMTGREAPVVADPTMLLTKEQWLDVAKPSINKPKEEFLLTYYLGEIPVTTKNFIKEQAAEHNLEIVNLADIKVKEHYFAGPSEFLDYINSAKLFVTDSFHGAVFSILFETPFVITDRLAATPSMNSRINTLLSKFDLKERHISKIQKKEVLSMQHLSLLPILKNEREIAYSYLKKALH